MHPLLRLTPAALVLGCGSPAPASATDAGRDAAVEASTGSPSLTWTTVDVSLVEGDIVSVWGTSATDVYVGMDLAGSVYHLEAGVPVLDSLQTTLVGGGWGSGPQDVFATGASAWLAKAGVGSNGGLFRSSGYDQWTSVASGVFDAVWGSSPTDVYAVGPGGVFHSTDAGGTFVQEHAAGTGIVSVWGSSAADVYVTTTSTLGTILHSAGDGTWKAVYSEPGFEPWGLWGSGPGDVYALLSPDSTSTLTAHVVHLAAATGGSWTTEVVDWGATKLVALWGSGRGDVYVGGWNEDASGKNAGGALYHSTGHADWTRVDLPGSVYQVRSIWGSRAADVYAGIVDAQSGAVLLHGQP
jgi:hypothetical protein